MYPGLSTVPCALLLFTVDLPDLGFSWTFSLSLFFSFLLVFLFGIYYFLGGFSPFLRDRLIHIASVECDFHSREVRMYMAFKSTVYYDNAQDKHNERWI